LPKTKCCNLSELFPSIFTTEMHVDLLKQTYIKMKFFMN
jgi:hypothetical protein